jgi:hypothetical protein
MGAGGGLVIDDLFVLVLVVVLVLDQVGAGA